MYYDSYDKLEFFIAPDGTLRNHENRLPIPDLCPHCFKHISPTLLSSFVTNMAYIEDLETADISSQAIASYQCPACKNVFSDYLECVKNKIDKPAVKKSKLGRIPVDPYQNELSFEWKSVATAPRKTIQLNIPEGVSKLSKRFVDIYRQAAQAESDSLDEIAGMGYRKAIEILLTDFLIAFPPNDSVTREWVTNPTTTAGSKIVKIDNSRIRTTAKAISWIGNDESHYTRVNEEKDIQEMKKFIKLLLTLVEQELIFDEAENFTNK